MFPHLYFASQDGAEGIVIVGTGLGHVNLPFHDAIEAALKAGTVVVMSTRVHQGRVQPVYSFKEGGVPLKRKGVILADDLNPPKARILLMLALTKTKDPKEIQKYFDR